MPTPARKKYQAIIGFVDKAERKSSMRFWISSADYAAWNTDVTAGNVSTLINDTAVMSLADVVLARAAEYSDDPSVTFTIPTDENAVNSAKLLVLMQDTTTGKKFSGQLPARDGSKYNSVRGSVIIAGTGVTTQVTAWIAAIEAGALSEDGNAVAVYAIRVVGKGTAA